MAHLGFNKRKYKMSEMSKYIVITLKERKLTQTKLAEVLSITPAGMSKKIRTNNYSYEDLLMIFEALGTTDDEILELMKV